jgi:hypothetical protein
MKTNKDTMNIRDTKYLFTESSEYASAKIWITASPIKLPHASAYNTLIMLLKI